MSENLRKVMYASIVLVLALLGCFIYALWTTPPVVNGEMPSTLKLHKGELVRLYVPYGFRYEYVIYGGYDPGPFLNIWKSVESGAGRIYFERGELVILGIKLYRVDQITPSYVVFEEVPK